MWDANGLKKLNSAKLTAQQNWKTASSILTDFQKDCLLTSGGYENYDTIEIVEKYDLSRGRIRIVGKVICLGD